MHRFAKSLVSVAIGAAFAAPALADENVDFLGFADGSETVNYTLDYDDDSLDRSGTVSAGGFLTSVNGGPSFTSYCVDLYQFINFADGPYGGYSLVAGASNAIGRFLGDNRPTNTSVQEAAFQIVLWELTYETSGDFDLADGTARFFGGSAESTNALLLASSWLSLGDNVTPFAVYQSTQYQDVVTQPIPEPSTYAMMVAGLAGLGYMARRRRARQA